MIMTLILGGAVLAIYFFYLTRSASKKRFIREILRQLPYLIPRYYV